MNDQTSHTLIAPCGMNCNICMAYLRDKNTCNGCRKITKNETKTRVNCVIRNCEHLKTLGLEFCSDRCPKFPCRRLKQLDERYRTKYKMSMLDNLEFIRTKGLDQFVAKEKERWRCEICGSSISVHHGYCLHCKKKREE